MPHKKELVDALLRLKVREIFSATGAGSWEEGMVSESAPDGRATLVLAVVPHRGARPGDQRAGTPPAEHAATPPAGAAAPRPPRTADDRDEEDRPPVGRPPSTCAVDIAGLLARGPAHFSDVVAAMEAKGHSATTAQHTLRWLKRKGLVAQPMGKGTPYCLPFLRPG